MIAALVVIAMLSNTGWLIRTTVRDFQEEIQDTERFIDMSVVLHVVRADPNGKELLPGRPRLDEVCEPMKFGGIIDTKAERPSLVSKSKSPTHWYCSEQQLPIILHRDGHAGHLVEGGMGAGKTTCGIMWTYFRWLEHLGQFREGAIVAPTNPRLDIVLKEMIGDDKSPGIFPRHWFSYRSSEHLITMCDGTRIRGLSTYKQSDAQGSRLQGQNWSWGFADEIQDQVEEFINFMARLRSGRKGGAPRYASSTAKDSPAYRDLKTKMSKSGIWRISRLLGPDSPFIFPDHWEAMKGLTTDNEYRRLVLAEDLPPESRLYHTWDRKENLRPIPFRARKITSVVISRKTNNPRHHLLIGHDPGAAKAGSVWLDAYELPTMPGEVIWWVRGEHFTLHKTAEEHALGVLEAVRKSHSVNIPGRPEIAHVRSQPLGQAEDRPDLSIQKIWERVGFDFKFAQYSTSGKGCGQIKKETRIGMLNMLFCDALGRRRLFIECDDRQRPVAPLLVEALETMERDEKGRAEHEEKNVKHDKSDLPAALGYALHAFEKENAVSLRAEIKKGLG